MLYVNCWSQEGRQIWHKPWHKLDKMVLQKAIRICKVLILQDAPVAQLDRAFDYESKGRKFESCRAHH